MKRITLRLNSFHLLIGDFPAGWVLPPIQATGDFPFAVVALAIRFSGQGRLACDPPTKPVRGSKNASFTSIELERIVIEIHFWRPPTRQAYSLDLFAPMETFFQTANHLRTPAKPSRGRAAWQCLTQV
jgi:hypothetical protein